MKKLALSLVVGAALAFTPLSSFALTPMSADTMKDATGQAGVSIAVDEIVLYQTIGETMYIDTDGDNDGLATSAAAVTISGKETFTTIRALLDNTDRGDDVTTGGINDKYAGYLKTAFKTATSTHTGYATIMDGTAFDTGSTNGVGNRDGVDLEGDDFENIEIAALSIDVSSNALVSSKIKGSDVAAVVIGLPTIEICKTGDNQTIGVKACSAKDGSYTPGTGEAADNNDLIRIEKSDSVLTVLGGTLEIAAH